MRQRPNELKALALVLIVIAVSLPIQVMILFGDSPLHLGDAAFRLAPMNWLVMLTALANAVLIYQASRWVYLSAPLFLLTVAWNNWLVAETGLNFSSATAWAATLGVVIIHLALFTSGARKIFENPGLRWWRTAPRRRMSIKAVICPVMGGELSARTFDLSTGGAFFALVDSDWAGLHAPPFRNLHVGARCSIMLMLDQIHIINCGAEIVRHGQDKGSYPSGFALRFLGLDSGQKKVLSTYLTKVPQPIPFLT